MSGGRAELRRLLPIALGACLAVLAFAWNAADAVFDRPISVGEGADLLAARAAMGGRVPGRDFACAAGPLFPFVAGPPLAAIGFGTVQMRLLNALLAAAGLLVLGIALAQRTRRAEIGAVAAFCVAASPHWTGAVVAGGSAGPSTAFLCLAAAAALSTTRFAPRLAALAIAGALAVGCAPLAIVAVAPLAICLGAGAGSRWRRVAAACAGVAVPAAALAPFAAISPDGGLADAWAALSAGSAAKAMHGVAAPMFAISPGAALALAAGLVALPSLVAGKRAVELGALAAAAAGVVVAIVVPGEDSPTIVPIAPLVAGAGLAAAWNLARGGGSPLRHALWLTPLIALYLPIPSAGLGDAGAETGMVAAYVRGRVPGGPILTPLPAIAVAAGREVLPGTELGAHAVLTKGREKDAARLHLTTLRALTRAVERRAPRAIVLHRSDDALDFGRDRSTGARHGKGAVRRFQRAVSERYERAFTTRSLAVYVPRRGVDAGR